ncbi:MAG: DUF4102 domain-containing protein [Nostoc sp.]|uniref:DUF4102 domain-containing protein n=1 Tax=Nostoc sp. TaxID=1180 RepID=UPI002FFAF022
MKHNSDVPGQLTLLTVAPTEKKIIVHDPYWDEILAPQQAEDNHWNPADFGEVPRKLDSDGQPTIFYDDSHEPPDPDDYQTNNDYHQAWAEWRTLVGAQVNNRTIDTTVKTRVGGKVTNRTQKTAPQHDTHWVEKYWVERSDRKYWYFRYCWMLARKKNRIYLGSVDSNLARQKKEAVEISIINGRSPVQIQELICSWRGDCQKQQSF